MKQTIILIAISLLSVTAFCQVKKDTTIKAAPLKQPIKKQFLISLNEDELNQMLYVIGTSGELTSMDAKKAQQFILSRTVLLDSLIKAVQSDSALIKKTNPAKPKR